MKKKIISFFLITFLILSSFSFTYAEERSLTQQQEISNQENFLQQQQDIKQQNKEIEIVTQPTLKGSVSLKAKNKKEQEEDEDQQDEDEDEDQQDEDEDEEPSIINNTQNNYDNSVENNYDNSKENNIKNITNNTINKNFIKPTSPIYLNKYFKNKQQPSPTIIININIKKGQSSTTTPIQKSQQNYLINLIIFLAFLFFTMFLLSLSIKKKNIL